MFPPPTTPVLHQDINLPTSITTYKQPPLFIERHAHPPKAMRRTLALISVVEYICVSGSAVGGADGLAVGWGEGDGGDFVTGGDCAVP